MSAQSESHRSQLGIRLCAPVVVLLAGWLWLGAAPACCAAAGVTASLDRDTTSPGESVTLSLTFDGGPPQELPNFALPAGLSISNPSRSSQVIFNNGQLSSTETYSYSLTPTQIGEYTIPAIRVTVGGQTLSTQPLKLKVVKSQAPSGTANNPAAKLAFLQLVVPKNDVYLGEVVPVEIRLYCQSARDLQMAPLQSDGFTVGKTAPAQQSRTVVDGQVYNLVVFRMAVAPAKTGSVSLGPAQCNLTLLVQPSNPRRRRDPFDPFGAFDDPFGFFGPTAEHRPVTLTSDPQPMRVLPLPSENVPPSFNGAVGDFTFSLQAAPTNVAVGDPITLKIQIAGTGALDALTLPALDLGPGFKVYPPTSKLDTTDPLGTKGVRTFECVVTPQAQDIKSLPPLAFSYFDPQKKSYQTLQQAPIPLVVRPAAAGLAGSVGLPGAERQVTPPAADIINIKARLGVVSMIQPPLIQRSWFLALQGVPVLVWLTVLLRRRYHENLERNPRLVRRRQVERIVEEGRLELRRLAEANQGEAFFATVFRLLQEQLGERLDLPASSITEAVLEERLRPQGVADETLASVHEVFQQCNQARYAPIQASEGLLQFIPKVESALNSLANLRLNC
jgi:hypothetical protein